MSERGEIHDDPDLTATTRHGHCPSLCPYEEALECQGKEGHEGIHYFDGMAWTGDEKPGCESCEFLRAVEADLRKQLGREVRDVNRFALALRKIRRGADHPEGRQGHAEFYEAIEWAGKIADEALTPDAETGNA